MEENRLPIRPMAPMPMNFKRPMNFPAQGFNPQNPNQKLPPIFYYNLDDPKVEKRWRNPKEDLTDYFNYGHNETTWKLYAEKVVKLTNKMDNFMHKDSSCNVLNDKLPLDLGGFGPPHFEPIQKLPFFEIIKKNKERFFFQQLADRNEFKNQLQNSLTGDFVEENYSDMKHPLPQQATHTPMYGHGYPPYSAYHNNQNRMGPPQDTSNLANSSMFRGGNRPFPGDREKGPIQGREERKTDIRERDRERERERDRERDRERERERERDRERERERERDREKERSRKKRGRSRSGSFSPRKATPTSRDREERGRRDRDSKKKDRKDRDHDRKRRRSSLSSEDKRDRRDREDRKKRKDRERSRDGRHGGREDKDRDRGDYSGNKTKKESASNIHMRIQTRK